MEEMGIEKDNCSCSSYLKMTQREKRNGMERKKMVMVIGFVLEKENRLDMIYLLVSL